ncbi:MAG: AzlD domain-containing protein, partial [Candidatus Nanopelagicales bacterium]
PIVMLSALVIVQTFSQGQTLVFDARLLGLLIAFLLLLFRAPFIVVVIAAAFVSALFRYLFN